MIHTIYHPIIQTPGGWLVYFPLLYDIDPELTRTTELSQKPLQRCLECGSKRDVNVYFSAAGKIGPPKTDSLRSERELKLINYSDRVYPGGKVHHGCIKYTLLFLFCDAIRCGCGCASAGSCYAPPITLHRSVVNSKYSQ